MTLPPGYFGASGGVGPTGPPQVRARCGGRLCGRRDGAPDAESAFVHIYGESPNAFWLDSGGGGERARFSFIGDSGGPLGAAITYDLAARRVRIERCGRVEVREE